MDRQQLFYAVLVLLLTNVITAFTAGIFCYNAGWREGMDFCTENHIRAIEDWKR